MCHYSEFHKITYVNCRRNDLQDDVKFSLGKCFLATQKTLQSSTRKTQNHAICWLRDQRVKEHSCIWNYSKSYRRTFSETNNKFIPSFVKLICLLSFEVCFCRDILPSFCLVGLCTSASDSIRLKNLLFSRIRILRECLCISGPVDYAWDTDFAHFLCVVRHLCTYTKTTIRSIGSLYFSEFYGN